MKIPERELKIKISEFSKKLVNEDKMSNVKPCQLQYYILRYIENPEKLFSNYHELDDIYKIK